MQSAERRNGRIRSHEETTFPSKASEFVALAGILRRPFFGVDGLAAGRRLERQLVGGCAACLHFVRVATSVDSQ